MTEENRPEWGPIGPANGENANYGQTPGGYSSPAAPTYSPPEEPNAQSSMIVGILGLVLGFLTCGLGFIASPIAMVMGLRSKRAIEASGGKLGGAGSAQTGFITGLIGTLMLVVAVLSLIAAILFFVILAASSDTDWLYNALSTSVAVAA